MNSKSRLLGIAIITQVVVLLITSCQGMAGAQAMQVWLDQPLEGAYFEPGATILIQAHARDVNGPGITEIQFYANGEKLASVNTDASSPLVSGIAQWQPEPGDYEVSAMAMNISGQSIASGSVHIEVIGLRENGELPLTISITPTFTATGTKTPITPTFTPTSTKKSVTPTFTFTPKPPGSMSIWADESSIFSGGCTFIRWTSTNVTNLSINGNQVDANGDMSVCPTSSITYTLRGQSSTGAIEKSTYIEVNSVPPPTPPCPSGRTSSLAYISMPGGNCSSHSVGEHFTLCFNLNVTGIESVFYYSFEDYTGASGYGSENPSGTKTVLFTGTFTGDPICKNMIITEPTGLEAMKLVLSSSTYTTSESDYPIVWIKVVP